MVSRVDNISVVQRANIRRMFIIRRRERKKKQSIHRGAPIYTHTHNHNRPGKAETTQHIIQYNMKERKKE